jgi:hypothetical protein
VILKNNDFKNTIFKIVFIEITIQRKKKKKISLKLKTVFKNAPKNFKTDYQCVPKKQATPLISPGKKSSEMHRT